MEGAELELFERTLRRATDTHSGAALDAALSELGWHEALAGHARDVVGLLFEHQGRAGTTSSALDDVLAGALGIDAPGTAVVLPAMGRFDPPGREEAGRLVVDGVGTARVVDAQSAVVAVASGASTTCAVVERSALECRAVAGMDPWLGLVRVTGDVGAFSPVEWEEEEGWPGAVPQARLALSHQLIGA